MRQTGMAAPSAPGGDELAGPVFAYSDPLAEKLLYYRARWALPVAPEMPSIVPIVDPAPHLAREADAPRLTSIWTRAWSNLWDVYEHVERNESVPGLTISYPALMDWQSQVVPAFLADDHYSTWSVDAHAMRPAPLGTRYAAIEVEADSAYRRGVRSVYVLPVGGFWNVRIRDSILLVSVDTHEDSTALAAALGMQ